MKNIMLINTSDEPKAFTWIPMVQPGQKFEAPEDRVEELLRDTDIKRDDSKKKPFRATEKSDAMEGIEAK